MWISSKIHHLPSYRIFSIKQAFFAAKISKMAAALSFVLDPCVRFIPSARGSCLRCRVHCFMFYLIFSHTNFFSATFGVFFCPRHFRKITSVHLCHHFFFVLFCFAINLCKTFVVWTKKKKKIVFMRKHVCLFVWIFIFFLSNFFLSFFLFFFLSFFQNTFWNYLWEFSSENFCQKMFHSCHKVACFVSLTCWVKTAQALLTQHSCWIKI